MAHFEDTVDRYFNSCLPSSERAALFAHTEQCSSCRQYFEDASTAQRLLSGNLNKVSKGELSAIRGLVIHEAQKRESKKAFSWRSLFYVAAPALSTVALLFVFLSPQSSTPPGGEWTARGTVRSLNLSIEVLCFDQEGNTTARHRTSGTCPAPGFLKVVYASPTTTPAVTVGVFSGDEVRFVSELVSPLPSSVAPKYAPLKVDEELRVVAVPEIASAENLAEMNPILTIRGLQK